MWAVGLIFFSLTFIILMCCIMVLSREKTFRLARFLFGIQIRIMGIRLTVSGREHVEKNKTYLIMGNHQSLFDLFVVPPAIPGCYVGVEAAYHFSIPVWGHLIKRWGNIPIHRKDLKKAIDSLEKAKETLVSGTSIIILPEGHRTRNGKIGEFKKGPFHLAKNANTDILPFAIQGLYRYNKKGALLLSPGPAHVQIGPPIPFSTFQNLPVDALRDKVRNRIISLQQPT